MKSHLFSNKYCCSKFKKWVGIQSQQADYCIRAVIKIMFFDDVWIKVHELCTNTRTNISSNLDTFTFDVIQQTYYLCEDCIKIAYMSYASWTNNDTTMNSICLVEKASLFYIKRYQMLWAGINDRYHAQRLRSLNLSKCQSE